MRPIRHRRRATIACGCVVAILLSPIAADAGAPFRTDDPEPVELQHYELYLFSMGKVAGNQTSGFLPAVEFNYGLISEGQFHIETPIAFNKAEGGPRFGYGDTEIGFKYRFLREDNKGWLPQLGTFPLLQLPTGDEAAGLGAGHVRAFLPIWLQKSFGDWRTYGGGGFWINDSIATKDQDYWFFGWAVERKITDKLRLGGEIFHQTADKIGGRDSTGFNVGVLYDLNEHNHLLFSAGRGIQNASETNRFSWYIAYQITGP
jgi:hypothetical protein